MRFVLPSVHHSGTHFVKDELLGDYREYFTNTPVEDFEDQSKILIHCERGRVDFLEQYLSCLPCIVPLRHPRSVAQSWKARGKPLDPLPPQWDVLIDVVDKYHPFYLPLDSSDRDYYLWRINHVLGLNLTTDWKVVQSSGMTATLSAAEEADVQTILRKPFFDRFYSGVSYVFRQAAETPLTASSGAASS